MFFSGLVQYNSRGESLGSNLRLRWEYTPGSELFIVYTMTTTRTRSRQTASPSFATAVSL